jgi:hypothetical protein
MELSKITKERNEWDMEIPIHDFNSNDVFVVGFPKSGNTWMQSIISGLYYGIDTKYLSDRLAQEIVPDVHVRKYYKRFGNINFFKSHHLPKPEYKRVIYIVRDGRDAMVSYYKMNQLHDNDISFSDMIIHGKNIFPSTWYEHVKKWMDNPYNSKIIYIRYEDLLLDTFNVIKKLCEFIEIKRDKDLIERVISGTTFELMQEKAKFFNGMGHKNLIGDKGIKFFRRGKIGSYIEEMPQDLKSIFEKRAYEQLNKFNYI